MKREHRTPPERSGARLCPRDGRGRLVALDPLTRFLSKCEFDAATGCVVWTAGTTQGRGHSVPYGSFWHERRWTAHRWAAKHIHGLHIDDPTTQVDHNCPPYRAGFDPLPPNTLCVAHLQVVPATINRELQWIRAQVGLDPLPPAYADDPDALPFHAPPDWWRAWLTRSENGAKRSTSTPHEPWPT